MTKYLFVVWYLVLSVSSYSAQFIDHPDRPSFEARYPLLNPQEQLTLTSLDKGIPLNKLKDRLLEDYLKVDTQTLPTGQKNSAAPMSNSFSPIIQEFFKAIMNYLKSSLAPLFPSQFRTVTTTEEKTSHFSCTVSTTACVGRHRRDVIKHLLEKQTALPLTNSILGNGSAPSKFNLSDEEKKVYSEHVNPSSHGSLSYFDPELLESSMIDPVTTSLEDKNSLVHLISMQQLPPNQAASLLSRLGLNTITITITNFTSLTHTSYPVCSSRDGTVSQCPN